MRTFLPKTLLIFFAMTSLSCEQCTNSDICKSIYLADMICSKLALAVPTVETGAAFAITTIIKNVAESTNFCETESAGASNTQYNVKYRADENAPWDDAQFNNNGNLVFDVFVGTDPLDPDQTDEFEPMFKMDSVGYYRFEANADGLLEVTERDENNNGGNDQGNLNGLVSQPSNVVIVKVVASKGHRPTGEKPVVNFLGVRR
ncbi:MAG: hypothetical protein R2792_05855 [Saprospiraceae bacterium]